MDIEARKQNALNQIKKFCELPNSIVKNLEDFVAAVVTENEKLNLIGKSTIEDIWSRHILDSAQLWPFIDKETKNKKCADLGSGAGFPGLVLSILGLKEMHLIEKSFRKSEFLRKSKLFSQNRVFIHQTELEKMVPTKFDLVTSRALAPLSKLFHYGTQLLQPTGYALFLKGKNLSTELAAAQKEFEFNYKLFPSLTSQESNVIKVFGIVPKTRI